MSSRTLAAAVVSCLTVAALAFSVSPELHAQAQATSGVIRGTVTDAQGQPASGASVVLRNTATNVSRTTTTNERGQYVAAALALGTYEITARMPGANPATMSGVELRLGATIEANLRLGAVQLAGIEVTATEPTRIEGSTKLDAEITGNLPNNGRNFLDYTLLTPGVSVVQGPDGDEITVSGQRGIYNNVSVDGADFNNPFFGEQRGGQRPPFTFNLDAVQEMVVVQHGANAEFGRSGSGFINVVTKSGTNRVQGSVHYYGQGDALAANDFGEVSGPDFYQHQFGFTLGGPLMRDRLFFFMAYDQQLAEATKQTDPARIDPALRSWMDTAFGGALAGDYGPIARTNNAQAFMLKLDWNASARHTMSLKYNFSNTRQENGTFDVNTWARSANAVERDYSHAVNASLVSLLSNRVTNELRLQYAREDRPRPYEGPGFPGTSGTLFNTSERPFPDTGADFAFGYRWGMPFFIPVEAYDQRIQLVDNLTVARGNHLFKMGIEYNRTQVDQTFIGFANERFIFGSVQGFLNYVGIGPQYVECSDVNGALVGTSTNGSCAAFPGTSISGPLQLYLQLAPVQAGTTVRDVGTQQIVQTEFAAFLQDTWKVNPKLTVNYGLRFETQGQPDPITPPSTVFFSPFIGQTINGYAFPSDGTIPSDWSLQPRLGIVWDLKADGSRLVRASGGLYVPRSPGLIFASTRTSNGSIGQNIFRASFFNGFGVTPPTYGPTPATPPTGTPDHPGVFVTDQDFQNPRVWQFSLGYEQRLTRTFAAGLMYNFAKTTNLNRFVDRNAAVFGSPFDSFPGNPANGLGSLTTLESSAKSQYHGFTLTLNGAINTRLQMQVNYTLSFDKSDDDNERDPFSFRYAQADSLHREYNWSDRDQRHRFNMFFLWAAPAGLNLNLRTSIYSAQPTSENCGANNQGDGTVAATPQDRICPNGSILLRNTIRKDNEYFSVDLRLSRPFPAGRGTIEPILEVFNVFNRVNIRNPSAPALLFNFDGTIRSGYDDSRRVQMGLRYVF